MFPLLWMNPHMSRHIVSREEFQHPGSSDRLSLSSLDEMDMEQRRLEGFYTRGHYEPSPAVDKRYQSSGLAPYFQQGGRDGSRMSGQWDLLTERLPVFT